MTTDQIQTITKEAILGIDNSDTSPEGIHFRMEIDRELVALKAKGMVIDVPTDL